MNTLKGVFGDTKPKYKRNFIQENMKQLRAMQGYWQNKEKQIDLTVTKPTNKYQNVPSRVGSHTRGSQSRKKEHPSKDKTTEVSKSSSKTLCSNSANPVSHVTQVGITHKNRSPSQRSRTSNRETSEKDGLLIDENISSTDSSPVSGGRTSRSLGCQTIDPKNTSDLYEGVIKYPSSRKLPSPTKKQLMKRPPTREMGLQTERSLSPVVTIGAAAGDTPTSNDSNELNLQKLSLSQRSSDVDESSEVPEINHVRNTRDAHLRSRTPARATKNLLRPPPSYKKGVVPKYLQERKEQWQKEAEQQIRDTPDPACPPGHVSLPDNERIETLKMLRKSYADLIQELNMMPVRTDTLRMRNRKMELEKQLNKIEQGIKVFSRPKVFVKIGA